MNLLVDIGNTTTKVGAHQVGESGYNVVTFPTSSDDLDYVLDGFVGEDNIARAIISSVVPKSTGVFISRLEARGIEPLIVDATINLPFSMGYRTPETLGADRIAGAAGAVNYTRERLGDNNTIVSVDAGTAVTFDIVSPDSVFLGGPIAAGPELLRRALSGDTAQLPDVPLFMPDGIISGSSEDAVRTGIMVGFVEGCLGILRRISEQTEGDVVVVFSGGWGRLLADEYRDDGIYRPTNLFDGLVSLGELN